MAKNNTCKDNEVYNIDLVFSIGVACRPAYHLKNNGLRKFASPLDWLNRYSLDTVIHLFNSSFKDFFENIEEDSEWNGTKYRKIWDVENHICSIHHFHHGTVLSEEKQKFCKKMRERYLYLDMKVKESNTFAMVSCREETREELLAFLLKFSWIYPNKKILLINIRNKKACTEFFLNKLNENCEFHEYVFDDTYQGDADIEEWKGNDENWSWALKHYKLHGMGSQEEILKKTKRGKSVIIYGAGDMCKRALVSLKEQGMTIDGIAVTEEENNPKEIMGLDVKCISKYNAQECIFVVAIKDYCTKSEIVEFLIKKRACAVGSYYDDYKSIKWF